MIPDRLQYFLEHVWIDQECDQIWTLGPRIYHKHAWKIQEIMITSLTNIICEIRESEVLKMLEEPSIYFDCSFIFEIGTLEIGNF